MILLPILFLGQVIRNQFSDLPFPHSVIPMGILLKMDNLPFWTGLVLIIKGSLQQISFSNKIHMEGSGMDPATFQKNSSLKGLFGGDP